MTRLLVAPFTHGDIRDWPAASFVALIGLLLDRVPDVRIAIVGTATQRIRADEIVRPFDPEAVPNLCGRLSWPALVAAIRAARCVIGNNSGITHLSAHHRVPTVCIFGGAHQRIEWRPLGASAVTLSRAIGCSPCALHRTCQCPYAKACLTQITPEAVYAAIEDQIGVGALRTMIPNDVIA